VRSIRLLSTNSFAAIWLFGGRIIQETPPASLPKLSVEAILNREPVSLTRL
jgi:hypothetical protein